MYGWETLTLTSSEQNTAILILPIELLQVLEQKTNDEMLCAKHRLCTQVWER